MQMIHGPNKFTWTTVFPNDIDRMAQGVGNLVRGGGTIFFIHRPAVTAVNRVEYGWIFVSIRPNKAETHRFRITVVGNRLSYEGTTAIQFASLITTNILLNIVVSTTLEMFMCADIHYFY